MSLICTAVKKQFERVSFTTHSCCWPFGEFRHLRCGWTLRTARYKCLKKIKWEHLNGALENAPPNWAGLEGSSAPDVRSIVQECGGNTYDALLRRGGGGGGGGSSGGGGCHVWQEDRGSHRRKRQWWKTNHLCPRLNTESYILRLLFYQIAFVRRGGFLNNAIG